MTSRTSATTRRCFLVWTGALAGARIPSLFAAESIAISPQPYFANVRRAVAKMAELGAPLAPDDAKEIAALAQEKTATAVAKAETILDRYTLALVDIAANRSVRVSAGSAPKTLVEQGWRMFLVRVSNPGERKENLSIKTSGANTFAYVIGKTPASMSQPDGAQRPILLDTVNKAPLIKSMWLMSELDDTSVLSGIPVEYRIVKLLSRDHGQRSADFDFMISPKSDDWRLMSYGHREFAFHCLPSRDVTLGMLDTDGRGCMASLIIKDKFGRIYPAQAMRLAPDMAFQPQIYRANGETVRLPDGEYTVESWRGPEYLRGTQTVKIRGGHDHIDVRLERWIDPAKWDWYSGDTHIHAAGCAHYENPTEGVTPETMIRHVRGEGLSIGDVLSWGPGWYYQKQFFTGHAISPPAELEDPDLQAANSATWKPHPTPEDAESLLRYDVEVSGFPSSYCGHLVLLRLKKEDYPGTTLIEDWPSWNLPILKWVREQGAVGGYAHCGIGMEVDSTDLPNYEIPPMNGIGTQEAIVDVTHGFADFLSGCNTQTVAELNAWYHMLNCGFRLAMIGETDWPCVSGDRVGMGRSYVKLDRPPTSDTGYDAWVRGLQKGTLYCGDGRSHILEFSVNGHATGAGDVVLGATETVGVHALVAARLEPKPTPETEAIRTAPMWWGYHLERARIGNTRNVAVELIVNGMPVDKAVILADGTLRPVQFKANIARSSWVALRILPSVHTYPVFVMVGGKPIRASKKSAQWCRACVDKLWEVKSPFMRDSERPEAAKAWDHARKTYDAIIAQCEAI